MFKICIIGCGYHSNLVYGRSLQKYHSLHADRVRISGCCDLNAGLAESYRERYGFEKAYTDWRVMLDEVKPDAVVAILPVDYVASAAVEIMEMGYPLLIEKPPGTGVRDNELLIEAAEKTGVPHMIDFNRRYSPMLRRVREILDKDSVKIDYLTYEMYRWRRLEKDFYTTAIHAIDACRYVTGSDYAIVKYTYRDIKNSPAINIYIEAEMRSGARVNVTMCPSSGVVIEKGTLSGENAYISFDTPLTSAPGPEKKIMYAKDRKMEEIHLDYAEGYFVSGGFYFCVSNFFDGLIEGRGHTFNNSFKEALQSSIVAEGIALRKTEIVF